MPETEAEENITIQEVTGGRRKLHKKESIITSWAQTQCGHVVGLIQANYVTRERQLRAARNQRKSCPRHAENMYLRFQLWIAGQVLCARLVNVLCFKISFN